LIAGLDVLLAVLVEAGMMMKGSRGMKTMLYGVGWTLMVEGRKTFAAFNRPHRLFVRIFVL
jgi:hypothetical protein